MQENNVQIISPKKALNKAFLKVKPSRNDIENFKSNLIALIDKIDEFEFEEFHKNLVSDFLKKTYYHDEHFINTKDRKDLVIYNGKDAQSKAGVIIEVKKPSNTVKMLKKSNLNTKALQELLLYYLRERITEKNSDVKHLIATNIYEWFIFDAHVFERAFVHNRKLIKDFKDFEAKRLADNTTDFFYREIAAPAIEKAETLLEFTYLDIRDYESSLRNADKTDDRKLIAVYKIFSPEHLLKLPFANDSNSLDQKFYTELLHIIGLNETKQKGKKLIERNPEGKRNSGSLLENTITVLDSHDKILHLDNPLHFGADKQERLFNVALELIITWINRILFLKLLEAQQINYHKGDKSYAFLNIEMVRNFDDLDSLFFNVLACKPEERGPEEKKLFPKVPYLNSSLFEPTGLEHGTIFISNLRDERKLPLFSSSVLKDAKGKRRSGELNAIEYLFEFLNAYDFSSEGSEDIQEENKTLINASVLGLIFEKINGYKDGSFFTPGFITMYMCRESISRAVVQKFNDVKGWECENLDQLHDRIGIEDKQEANDIVNSLRICDPAVGSGHFLVSALNEIIAVKRRLKILRDRQGKTLLRDYEVEVVNDELVITDVNGELFEYNPRSRESQRIQETLFHEKQTIIENCLFGVDINHNSVKICRLRLWIELLKNAYYKPDGQLETLPNIDINIKCGNSLISRYALDTDVKIALKKSNRFSIEMYRTVVGAYRNAKDKESKRAMEKHIGQIKNDFVTEILPQDPRRNKLESLKSKYNLTFHPLLFERTDEEKAAQVKEAIKLSTEIQEEENKIKEMEKMYDDAFEWRFEFPEVLNDDGEFVGFDLIIGNPPYGIILVAQETVIINQQLPNWQKSLGNDSYFYFIARGLSLLSNNGTFAYIVPNTWRLISAGSAFRKIILSYLYCIDTHVKPVFSEAVVDCDIIFASNRTSDLISLSIYDEETCVKSSQVPVDILKQYEIINTHLDVKDYELIKKVFMHSEPLKTSFIVKNGVKPYEKGKGNPPQSQEIVDNKPFTSEYKKDDTFKPLIGGSLFHRYVNLWKNNYWISYGQWLAAPRDKNIFDTPEKIIIRQTSDRIIATKVDSEFIMRDNTHIILPNQGKLELTFALAILNSRLIDFIYWTMNPEKGEALAQVKKYHIENLPIPNISESDQKPFIDLANQILEKKRQNPDADTSDLEEKIDCLVYELYGLTEEEIKIVEGVHELHE